MAAMVRTADQRGRITLFDDFANHRVIIERVGEDEIRLRKAEAVPKKLTLDELLAGITDENMQEKIDFGPPVGRELL